MRRLCRLTVIIAVGASVASAMGATTGAGYGLRPAAADGAVAYTGHLFGNRPFINVVDLAGGEKHEITPRAPGVAWEVYNPVWSPDGSQLAFVREGTGGGPSVAFLYVANSDGSDLHRVLRIKPWTGYSLDFPSWSPDGLRRAFGHGALYVVNSDGTDRRRLPESSGCNPTWSPDGNSLVYLVDARPCSYRGSNALVPGHRSIYRIDADGTHRRLLARGSFGDAAWSPDGRQIAYTDRCAVGHDTDWHCAVSVMNSDGRAKRRVLKYSFGGWVEWVAGGHGLLWQQTGLHVADLATGKSHKLASVDDQFVGISQDGNTIAIIPSRRQHIMFVTVNGQIVQRARWIHLDESVDIGWDNATVYVR